VGRDDVLDAAFERCGVIRVDAISDLFQMAGTLARQPRPKGNRLTIVTNAGRARRAGGRRVDRKRRAARGAQRRNLEGIERFLPGPWSHGNPVDVLGDADAGRYGRAMEAAIKDANSDGFF
jgi:acetyltransferase